MNIENYSHTVEAADVAVDTLLKKLYAERACRSVLQSTVQAMRLQRAIELRAERALPWWRRKLLRLLRP